MADNDASSPQAVPTPTPSQAEEITRALGQVFSNTFLYGPKHGVTTKSTDLAFGVLQIALETFPEITFSVSEESLMVNGVGVEQKNPLVKMFVSRLVGLEISNFTLVKGMTRETFDHLMEVMNRKSDDLKQAGGFISVMTSQGIENVKVRRVVLQQVEEDELIVSKGAIEQALGGSEAVQEMVKPVAEEAPRKEVEVAGILAFLKGDPSAKTEKDIAGDLSELNSDPRKLGELILKAAEVRRESAELEGGETLAGLVVGCLAKTCHAMMKDPSVKTQKGKKNLARTLILLERELIERMRRLSESVTDEDIQAVHEAFEEAQDDLKIDSLAEEYMRRRKAMEQNEKKILRYMKAQGEDGLQGSSLQEKLGESGLSVEGWNELLGRSGIDALTPELAAGSGGGSGGSGGMGAIGHLAMLLEQLEKSVEKGAEQAAAAAPGQVAGALDSVRKEVRDVTEKTNRKIRTLVDGVKADSEAVAKGGRGETMPKAKLLELLAEVVQELCQPLAVINCSVELILGKGLGEVSSSQAEMLQLAAESGARLKQLADKLLEISGVPKTLTPDAGIQKALYE